MNKEIFEKVARKCYLPTNNLLLNLINESDGKFKVSFSLTGTFVEFCKKYMPEIIDSFKELFKTGSVDMIEETYYHSLSGLYDELDEFEEQVWKHRKMIKELFNYKPRVFRNTEAIYDNRIAKKVADMGYKGIITEGTDKILNCSESELPALSTALIVIKLLLWEILRLCPLVLLKRFLVLLVRLLLLRFLLIMSLSLSRMLTSLILIRV